jgi:hypothetical protein
MSKKGPPRKRGAISYHKDSSNSSNLSASPDAINSGTTESRKRKSSPADSICCPCGFKFTALGKDTTYVCCNNKCSHFACVNCLDKDRKQCKYHPSGNVGCAPGMWEKLIVCIPFMWRPIYPEYGYTTLPYDKFVSLVKTENYPVRLGSQIEYKSLKDTFCALKQDSPHHVKLGQKMVCSFCTENVFINYLTEPDCLVVKVSCNLRSNHNKVIIDLIVYLPFLAVDRILWLACSTLKWRHSVLLPSPAGQRPSVTRFYIDDFPEPPQDCTLSCSLMLKLDPL